MSNVIVDKNKIDILANAISNKSGEPVTMTLDEMVTAVDNIELGITPSGNLNITHAGRTNVTDYETVTVPSANYYLSTDSYYDYDNNNNPTYLHIDPVVDVNGPGWISEGTTYGNGGMFPVLPSTTVTPTENFTQSFGGSGYIMEESLIVNAIPQNYVGSAISRMSSSDLTVSGATVTAPAGYYTSAATKSVATMELPTAPHPSYSTGYTPISTINKATTYRYLNIPPGYNPTGGYYTISPIPNGTEGTPIATKSAVSNHSVSVTPSVTNTQGYISGSNIIGTPVTVTATELASGNKEITSNGTNIDVVGYSTVSVNVSSQGGVTTIEDTLDASGGTIRTITTDTVINLTSLNATQNQTYTAPSGTAYNQVVVNVSGASSSGLEYEEGTWVQATGQNSVTINFTNTHSTPPSFYEIFLADSSCPADINSVLHIVYTNFEQLSNTTTKFYDSGGIAYNAYYGIIMRSYNTGSSTPAESMLLLTSSSSDASDSTIYNSRYWATETRILGFISSSRYFESGCTYYWRAVW